MKLEDYTRWNYRLSRQRDNGFQRREVWNDEQPPIEAVNNRKSERELRSNMQDEWKNYRHSMFGV